MSLAYRVSAFNRRRKWRRFLDRFQPTPDMRILDVGYSAEEYSTTDNFLEKHYRWPEQITALGIDPPEAFRERYPAVNVVQYDGSDFPFEDNEFDVCWSNAVVEHVGDHERQLKFLSEINRVSKSACVTTPNRFFPIEVHTRTPLLHYLPKSLFDSYLRLVGLDWAAGDYMHLLSRGHVKRLLAEAGVTNYEINQNRPGPFVVDFVISWGAIATAREASRDKQTSLAV
jgi:SAM-dependent methyltransferase